MIELSGKPAPDGYCKKPLQGKKRGLPIPAGASLLYIGRPPRPGTGSLEHEGVVTVAWITPAPGVLHLGFSFCSPKDRWCKVTGRDMALARIRTPLLDVPFLYDAERTVREVTRAVLNHDFEILEALIPGVTAWGHRRVPSWTKELGKRMGDSSRLRQAAKIWQGVVNRVRKVVPFPDFLGDIYIAPPTRGLPFNIMARTMRDIALGNGAEAK